MAIPTIVGVMTHMGLFHVARRPGWSGRWCTGSGLPKFPLLAAERGRAVGRHVRRMPVPVSA